MKELTVILSPQRLQRQIAVEQFRQRNPRSKIYHFPHQTQVDPHEPFLVALGDFLEGRWKKALWSDSWLSLAVNLSLVHRCQTDYIGHTQVLSRLQDAVIEEKLKIFFWLLPAADDYQEQFSDCSPWWRESMIQSEKRREWAWLTYVNEQIPFLGEILEPEFIHNLPSK